MLKRLRNSESVIAYTRLLKYLVGVRWAFALSVTGYLIFASTQPMLAKLMELIIEAIESNPGEARWLLAPAAVGVFLVRGFGSFLGDYFNEYVGASVIKKLKIELFDHLTVLPASFYDGTTHGQILHQLNNGVMRVQAVVTSALKTLIKEGLTVIALLGYVFYLNWKLSLVFLLVAPILGWLVSAANKKFRSIARKAEGAGGKALQVSKELMGNFHVVRSFGAQEYEYGRYKKNVDRIYKMHMKITKVSSIFTPLSQITVAGAMAFIIFLLLTPDVLASNTVGDLVGYLTAVALIPKPVRQLSRTSIVIQRGLVGAQLVFSLLDKKPEEDNGRYKADKVAGRVDIVNLSFTYPGAKKPSLENISISIKPGETVAIVGKSGSGKSTLTSLLRRTHKITDGSIFLDNIDINEYTLRNLRSHIAVVDQNSQLFNDTIRNNIAYADNSKSNSAIVRAAQEAQALEFINELPQQFDTVVGEDGVLLSGGQKQRIAITRAFLKNAPVLIMDEATSALDNTSEKLISRAIERLSEKRTVIIIAHRLSTIISASRVIVLDNGKVIEEGTHEELIANKGAYFSLYSNDAFTAEQANI